MLTSTSSSLTQHLHSSLPSSITTINLNPFHGSNPATWTVEQVEEWLINNNFHDSIDILCHQYRIDGQYLINIDEYELLHLTNNQQLCLQWKYLKQFYLNSSHQAMKRSSTAPTLGPPVSRQSLPNLPSDFRTSQMLVGHPQSQPQATTVLIEQHSAIHSPCQRPCEQIEDYTMTTCCFFISIRSDRKKTFLAFLLALSAVYICSFVITIVDERLPDPKDFPPLPDLILDNIQQIPWAFGVTEKIILIKMFVLSIIVVLHRHR
jgi:hypothetical protein